ncbi:BRCT domain-containing protein [Delftia acidovorans]|jgi:hypothetical protein|uniref:BRCT domain-containing protein n=1 Tax=Delftia acidovorans TaxID=80866 RepID=A0AAJ2R5Y9_DELAC|nr:BRCT domain-containing protein [Delftia acidovorans]MDX4958191.1 BRCT domain-containing protein [Delftia acidovorans]
MAAQPEMRFVYRNGAGEVSERMLLNWAEIGHYTKGHCTTKGSVLTFRKDRVSEYLNGSDALLGTPRSSPPPRPVRGGPVDARPRIHLTGFASATRDAMQSQADAAGLQVMQTMANGITFLVCGPRDGALKIEKARAGGAFVVAPEHFTTLLETGELPDETVAELGVVA